MALTATDSGTGLISTSKIVILDAIPTPEEPAEAGVGAVLLESGGYELLESGGRLLLESA